MDLYRCPSCGGWNRVSAERAAGKQPVCGRCKQALDTTGKPQDVDEKAMNDAIASAPVPVLVDFWAPWCGPCRAMAPVLESTGRDKKGSLAILKVNSDENPAASQRFGVRGIPTLVLFKNGSEAGRQVGAVPAPALSSWLSGQV